MSYIKLRSLFVIKIVGKVKKKDFENFIFSELWRDFKFNNYDFMETELKVGRDARGWEKTSELNGDRRSEEFTDSNSAIPIKFASSNGINRNKISLNYILKPFYP